MEKYGQISLFFFLIIYGIKTVKGHSQKSYMTQPILLYFTYEKDYKNAKLPYHIVKNCKWFEIILYEILQ